MKIFLLAALLLPFTLLAQNKKDNVIFAKPVYLKKAVNILLDNGFVMDKLDSNYNTIKTEFKSLCSDCIPELMFNIRIKDSVAEIKGKWRTTGGILGEAISDNKDYMYFDIMNERGAAPQKCFAEMVRIAKLFSEDISFSRQ